MEIKEMSLKVMYETTGILYTLHMWEDISCGKQTAIVFRNLDSQLGIKTG